MEIRSHHPLLHEDLIAEIPAIIDWFWKLGYRELVLDFDGLHDGDRIEPSKCVKLSTGEVDEFMRRAVAEGRFVCGYSEVDIRDNTTDPAVKFRICHEGDIHLETSNSKLIEQVKASWLQNNWAVYEEVGRVGKNREEPKWRVHYPKANA